MASADQWWCVAATAVGLRAAFEKPPTLTLSGNSVARFESRGSCLSKEAGKCRLPGIPIERLGGVGELDAIQRALNVARDAVGRHDQGGVHGVDVAAGYRAL